MSRERERGPLLSAQETPVYEGPSGEQRASSDRATHTTGPQKTSSVGFSEQLLAPTMAASDLAPAHLPSEQPPTPLRALLAPLQGLPTLLLLNRARALNGLYLLALTSALIAPLTLEVIFTHRTLWFGTEDAWQQQAPHITWALWSGVGSVLLVGWGLNRAPTQGIAGVPHLVGLRGVTAIPNPQKHYASLVTLIGTLIYVLFGLPSWLWMGTLGLPAFEALPLKVTINVFSLLVIPLSIALSSARFYKRSWLLLIFGVGWVIILAMWTYGAF